MASTSIANLNVQITGNARGLKSAFKEAAAAQKAWAKTALQKQELKLAGKETVDSLKTTLAVARSEIRRFARNRDVKVAVEIASANLQDAYLNARRKVQAIAAKVPIQVPIKAVAARGKDALASIRRGLKPVTVRVQLADRMLRDNISKSRARIEGLRKIRAVRIGLAAIDGVKLPAQAAMRSVMPLLRLARTGIKFGATFAHAGILTGINKIRGALGSLKTAGAGIGNALIGAFKMVTSTATVAATAVIAFARSGFKSIDATTTLSQQLGVTTESLSALQHAANMASVSEDALSGGLSKMVVNLGKAKGGSDEAASAFSNIGLNVDELTSLQPDQAFAKIADSIAKIEDPYKRAKAAQEIFGKSSKELMPLLLQGGDAVAKAAEDVKVFGNEVTAIESAKIAEADTAFKEAKASVVGLAQSVAVELAPYVSDLVKRFTAFITEGDGLRSKVAPAIDLVITGVGYLADAWYVVKAGVNAVQGVIAKMISLAVQGISGLVKGLNAAIDGFNKLAEWAGIDVKIGNIDTSSLDMVAGAFNETAKEFFDSMGENFDKGMGNDGSQAVEDWRKDVKATSDAAAQARVDAANKVQEAARAALALEDQAENSTNVETANKFADALASVKSEIDSLNQTPIEIKIAEMTKDFPDIAAAQIEEYRAALETLDMEQLGMKLRESLVTPVDEAQKQFEDIQRAFEAGVITTDEQQQLLDNLASQFEEAKQGFVGPSDQGAVAAAVGSSQSARLDQAFQNQQSRLANAQTPELKATEKSNVLLANIRDAMKSGLTIQVTEMSI